MKKTKTVLSFLIMVFLVSSLVSAAELTIRPDAQGARKGWANVGCGSGSSEYQCVDEVTLDTSDYLRTTGTRKETFSFENTGLGSETINSVTMHYIAMEHNSNKNRCFEAMTRSSGTDYLAGTQLCVGTTWEEVTHTYSTNPATGSAWTISEVDGLEAGMHGLNPDGGGRVAQVWAIVDHDSEPVATASANPSSGVAPLNVSFTGNVVGGDDPLSFLWLFQDGTNSTEQNPNHVFSAGTYNVSFKVTDDDGDMDTDFVLVDVEADSSPVVNPSAFPLSGPAPLTVNFTGDFTGGNSPFDFFWDFNDTSFSFQQNPVYTYNISGLYNAAFTVTDLDNDEDTGFVLINVTA